MSKYNLNALGSDEFENLVQAILKCVIGPGTTTFGEGKDGAREATYEGRASYPSQVEQWSGKWIFQAKFHDTDLLGMSAARNSVISDAVSELEKITSKYNYDVDNYILITNVPLSAVHARGTLDRLNAEFDRYRGRIKNIRVWGADDINRFLDLYPDVRRPYLQLLITGDVIAELLTQAEHARSDRATTVEMYLRTAMSREENAQLDQAGDVSEDAIPLQRIFFDLDAYIPYATNDAVDRYRRSPIGGRQLPMGEDLRIPVVRYLIGDNAPDRVVIVGGPGEGKSTIGQYMAQLHRSALLDNIDDMALSLEYVPETPRIPFRVVLKDFAQWLAESSEESVDGESLDAYISGQVKKLSTRDFGEKDLHEILKSNPALVILDGLDEVTDAGLRRRLVARLTEFLDRSHNTLGSNLQVVATTRPTNYSDQFDPKTFLHFRLHKLRDDQVRDYVKKWISARVLEEDKAMRLVQTVDDCLQDNQISLLMTTPLQVTILILIINSGGTPPRQREALFNEYLEVIYKREKAKGLGIVKTEKELLIGLHKFVGFILHEEATKANSSSATLVRSSYDSIVKGYLRDYDPYSPEEHIEQEWHAITVDAGERLVLIVESPANIFGFELRSIQEFFAACYLSDTSRDTIQRYERFACIAHLPHWRNVALFFAGRVGRNYPGEAVNIIEVCKDIDREAPDLYANRGAEVALELAAERALGPKRVLQRSLLEHGLGLFDHPMSFATRQSAVELIQRLPYEDIRDHVLPILAQRLPTRSHAAVLNACHLLAAVAPDSDVLAVSLLRLAAKASEEFSGEILSIITYGGIPSGLRIRVARELLDSGVGPEVIGERLAFSNWDALCAIAAEISRGELDGSIQRPFVLQVALNAPDEGSLDSISVEGLDDESEYKIILICSRAMGALMSSRPYMGQRGAAASRIDVIKRRLAEDLPEKIISGEFCNSMTTQECCWLPWLTHLALGKVTRDSWGRFLAWLKTHGITGEVRDIWRYFAAQVAPVALLVVDVRWEDEEDLRNLADTVVEFGGLEGSQRWLARLGEAEEGLSFLRRMEVANVCLYGPGILEPGARERVLSVLADSFDPQMHPIVLNYMQRPHGVRVNANDFDRLWEWLGGLPEDSPWRSASYSFVAAARAVEFGIIRNQNFEDYLDRLPDYVLASLAIDAALKSDDEDLRLLLPRVRNGGYRRYGRNLTAPKRRQIILRLLSFCDSEDRDIRSAALSLIMTVCFSAVNSNASKSAIRSRDLDRVHERLIDSPDELERAAAVALYAVRPPRSVRDWERLKAFMKSASVDEIYQHWSWVLPGCAELANDPSMWAKQISSVLEHEVEDRLAVILTDVLRTVLPREGQSLASMMELLSLPQVKVLPERS